MKYPTIAAAAKALRAGETTAVELVEDSLGLSRGLNEQLGMFLSSYEEQALAQASATDQALSQGEDPGPLAGIPLGIKDIISTAEGATTAQSLVLDRAWGDGDAVVIRRLKAAGGIVTGKLTTMEFAIGLPDEEKPFPLPRNPWNPEHWTGGSSSGSGSSVASGSVLGALGTDTAGSIRIPAAYCGITGLMGTLGRVPKSGCVPLGYSLDHIGPMARTAEDCAIMMTALAGHDESDLTSIDAPTTDYTAELTGDLTGVTIGVDRLGWTSSTPEDPALEGTFLQAVADLEARGASIQEIELPLYHEMTTANLIIMFSEALAYHRPDLQKRWTDYGRATRLMISSGAFYGAADYVQAQRARTVGRKAIGEVFDRVDLVVTPTAGLGAPSYDDLNSMVTGSLRGRMDRVYTPYWNVVGNPVISVPMGFSSSGLPLGMQIAARPFDEALVLRAADSFQRQTTWHERVPESLAGSAAEEVLV
ncbi:amidase [Citricoccus sp. GCM10030269]|uniref:amidase n=1 Tax=Citricoccus sp. GCM10030269 TaxID=3273388 RepID=UPI003611792B